MTKRIDKAVQMLNVEPVPEKQVVVVKPKPKPKTKYVQKKKIVKKHKPKQPKKPVVLSKEEILLEQLVKYVRNNIQSFDYEKGDSSQAYFIKVIKQNKSFIKINLKVSTYRIGYTYLHNNESCLSKVSIITLERKNLRKRIVESIEFDDGDDSKYNKYMKDIDIICKMDYNRRFVEPEETLKKKTIENATKILGDNNEKT